MPSRKLSLSGWRKKAWKIFSEFIRKKNVDENGMSSCFTCGAILHYTELQAGHYIASSISLALRFDERNVHTQCARCNMWMSGNLAQYALALKREYGDTILEDLDRDRRLGAGFKIYESGYRELFEKYSQRLKSEDS